MNCYDENNNDNKVGAGVDNNDGYADIFSDEKEQIKESNVQEQPKVVSESMNNVDAQNTTQSSETVENTQAHEQQEKQEYEYYSFNEPSSNPKSLEQIKAEMKAEKQRQKMLLKQRRQDSKAKSIHSTLTLKKALVFTGFALFLGVVGGLGFSITNYLSNRTINANQPSQSAEVNNDAVSNENGANQHISTVTGYKVMNDVSQIVQANKPAMVNISATTKAKLQDFFRGTYYQEIPVSGSGFVISEDDKNYYIATNNHVVDNGTNLSVAFVDESVAPATVKGKDVYNDIAVISVSKDDVSDETQKQIKKVEIGDSDNLTEGQAVIAMGNALGYGQSTTYGVISALDRTIKTEDGLTREHLIQTDAAINFGNSGGALIDASGRVIGINSAKNGANAVEGIGYAIPISKAEPIIKNILNNDNELVDEKDRGIIGIIGFASGENVNKVYGIPTGVYVQEVVKGSGAQKAGIVKGDVITEVGGFKVMTQNDIVERLQYYKIGDAVDVTLMRQLEGEYNKIVKKVIIGKKSKEQLKKEAELKKQSQEQIQEEPNIQDEIAPDEKQGEQYEGSLKDMLEEMFKNGN